MREEGQDEEGLEEEGAAATQPGPSVHVQPPAAPASPYAAPLPPIAQPGTPYFTFHRKGPPQGRGAGGEASGGGGGGGGVSGKALVEAQKLCKWANSALEYEDVATAVKHLKGALAILDH